MTIIVGRGGVTEGDFGAVLDSLETLATDLREMTAGRMPRLDQIADAPFIDDWRLRIRPKLCLSGIVPDHPVLLGPAVTTSELMVFAPSLGWCRTWSRFYRMGRPAGTGMAS